VEDLPTLLASAPPHLRAQGLVFRAFLSHKRTTGGVVVRGLYEKLGAEYAFFLDAASRRVLH
jgi:hypothetical protein